MPEPVEEQKRPPPLDTAGDEQQQQHAKRGVEETAAKKNAPTRKKSSGVNCGGSGRVNETSSPLVPVVAPATLVISGASPSAGSTTVTAGLAAALRYGTVEDARRRKMLISSDGDVFPPFFCRCFGKFSIEKTHTHLSRLLSLSLFIPLLFTQLAGREVS